MQYLVGIDIFYGRQIKSLNCDGSSSRNGLYFDELLFKEGEVMSGISYSTKKDFITDLQFYTNRLVPVKPMKKSKRKGLLFYDIFKTHRIIAENNKEKLIQSQMVGEKKGTLFMDQKLTSSWRLKQVEFSKRDNIIVSMQSSFKQAYLDVEMKNDLVGEANK